MKECQLFIKVKKTIKYLALGDSYTIGEAVEPGESFPLQLTQVLRNKGKRIENPNIIAKTGWRADELYTQIKMQKPSKADLITLLIGVNNQYQKKAFSVFKTDFVRILKKTKRLLKKKGKFIILSIPDYGFTPFGLENQESISKEIDMYNAFIEQTCIKYNLKFVNITDISREGLSKKEYVAKDDLHISQIVYNIIAQRILNVIQCLK